MGLGVKSAAEHFEHVLSRLEGIKQAGQICGGSANRCGPGRRYKMPGFKSSELKFALYISQRDFQVAHGHLGRGVAGKFHQNRHADACAKHLGSKRVAKLMRDDARPDPGRGSDLMQRNSQLVTEPHAATRAGKKKSVGGECILAAQQLEPMNESTDNGIHWNETLRPQFAKGHMNGPSDFCSNSDRAAM